MSIADPAVIDTARSFRKVLVANRGEIALRVMRACRQMGIATVAVYSDADRHALHVAAADEAVHLGASRSADSYLNASRLCEAVRRTGADAVHPGCGFLAENADFAERIRATGAEFIGPPASAMRLLGSKSVARQFVAGLGLPVVPGDDEADQDVVRLAASAGRIGYPVMIKAAAGGGGTGIRVVRDPADFDVQLTAARNEASSSFGDPRLLLEKYFERVRHIEVQLVADHHGRVLHLSDRECSIQRRRQKVVEEAPATLIDARLRERMAAAAVRIGVAAGYVGLGTVEFLVDEAARQFYFLEMNTRLQVEHGITELITGLDLVTMQIEVAEGRPIAIRQDDVCTRGHAIECRLYSEDPAQGFAPATGSLLHWEAGTAPDVRVDAGVASGTEVTSYYDPMLAKIMAWGPDRRTALRKTRHAVAVTRAAGVPTNQRFLLEVLDHPAFVAGQLSTGFVDEHRDELTVPRAEADVWRGALAAALQRWRSQVPQSTRGVRGRTFRMLADSKPVSVGIRALGGQQFVGTIGERCFELEVLRGTDERSLWLAVDGHAVRHTVVAEGDTLHVATPGLGCLRVEFPSRFRKADTTEVGGHYRASMTGRILEVLVEPGTAVKSRDRLVIMESMKMEHATIAGEDGVVTTIWVATGDVVEKGTLLVEIAPASPTPILAGS